MAFALSLTGTPDVGTLCGKLVTPNRSACGCVDCSQHFRRLRDHKPVEVGTPQQAGPGHNVRMIGSFEHDASVTRLVRQDCPGRPRGQGDWDWVIGQQVGEMPASDVVGSDDSDPGLSRVTDRQAAGPYQWSCLPPALSRVSAR